MITKHPFSFFIHLIMTIAKMNKLCTAKQKKEGEHSPSFAYVRLFVTLI